MKSRQDYLINKSHLAKNYPDARLLKDLFGNVQSYVLDTRNLINDTNDLCVKYLDDIGSFNVNVVQDLKSFYSLLTDLYVVNGQTANSKSIFDLSKLIFSNHGVKVNTNTNEIKLDNTNYKADFISPIVEIKNISVIPRIGEQINKDIFLGVYGEKINNQIQNITTGIYTLSTHSIDKQLGFSLLIDFGDIRPINFLSFAINTSSVPFLNVRSIEVANGSDLEKVTIHNSNSQTATGYDILDKSIQIDRSLMTINFDNQITRYIKIDIRYSNFELIKGKRIYELDINNLVSGFGLPSATGSIIFGPIQFSDEVLKASIDSVLKNYILSNPNINFSIAPTPTGTFHPLLNSIEYNPDLGLSNIVNYNNISTNSINTTNPVNSIYLKIDFTATEANLSDIINLGNINVESYIKRTRISIGPTNRNIITGNSSPTRFALTVLKQLNSYSGYNTDFATGAIIGTSNIGEIELNGAIKAVSIGSSVNPDISKNYFTVGQNTTRFFTKPEKIGLSITEKVTCNPEFDFDQYRIKIFGYSLPFTSDLKGSTNNINSINTIEPTNKSVILVLPIVSKGAKYKIIFNTNDSILLDISSRVFHTVTETYFIVEDTNIVSYSVFDEIGDKVYDGVVHTLLSGTKYITVFDFLNITVPTIPNLTFNTIYGISDNTATEFSLITQGFIFAKYFSGTISNVSKIVKTDLQTSYNNGFLVITNPKIIKYTNTLTGADYKNVFKLDNNQIVKNTLTFDINTASINPFISEVDYIDGFKEFNVTQSYEQINNLDLNIIPLLSSFIGDETTDIIFDGNTELFTNRVYSISELVYPGDWCLNYNTNTHLWQISLPIGIETSSTFDTQIIYTISSNSSTYGLYSVDYVNGIIYTTAPMDSRIVINYIFSNTYAQYEHFEKLSSNLYSVGDGNIQIKDTNDNTSGQYLVVYNTLNDISSNTQVYITPIVKDIILNVLLKTEIL
jgi:hypothetical protein